MHQFCSLKESAGESLMITTCGGDIEIPGKALSAQFRAELAISKKETAPRKPGRPSSSELTGEAPAE